MGVENNHIPIFLMEMYRNGEIKREELGEHAKNCGYCKKILDIYDKELKYEFVDFPTFSNLN